MERDGDRDECFRSVRHHVVLPFLHRLVRRDVHSSKTRFHTQQQNSRAYAPTYRRSNVSKSGGSKKRARHNLHSRRSRGSFRSLLGSFQLLLLHSDGVCGVLSTSFPARPTYFQRGRENDDVRQRMREPAYLLLAQPVHEERVLPVTFEEIRSTEETI